MKNPTEKQNSLAIKNPELAKQWHPEKNGVLTPNDVTPGSGKKVWWICAMGHEWEAIVANRAKGTGCPYCSGNRACADNSLQAKSPKLSEQWHPTKNGNLTPNDVTPGSNKKVWWRCEKGHEWVVPPNARMGKDSSCPYCSGRRACADNSLQALNPELAKQWHPTKNGDLTPSDVRPGSGKKAWWVCEKGHEWEVSPNTRTNMNSGCPYCSGKRACIDNCLQTLNPDLAKQWHPSKNGVLTPNDVTIFSNKKVWWQCEKGHEWNATVNNRSNGRDCPFCIGKRVCTDNSLQTLNPELAMQWHPTKNKELTTNDVTPNSGKKVWWQCERGHEWESTIHNRNYGNGCPTCNYESQTSFPEQVIYFYMKSVFNDALNRYKFNDRWEIDIFIPSLNLGIEYDGIFYHRNKKSLDFEKETYIAKRGNRLLRVKEMKGKNKECYHKDNVIYCEEHPSETQLNEVVNACFHYIGENITHKSYFVDIDVGRDRPKIFDLYIKGEQETSLLAMHPELSKQWHPTKNLRLKPDMVKPKSNKKVWWQCEKGHEWEAVVCSRSQGSGCPYCSGKYVCSDNCLQTLRPDLAKQWHPTKNGNLTPCDVTLNSNKMIWWRCIKGHEWKTTVGNRSNGNDCPFCSGKRACSDNCLLTLNPELSKQWHPIKNGELTPNDVTIGSGKKVWWLCTKGHEWKTAIHNRARGSDCPICAIETGKETFVKSIVKQRGSLQDNNPRLAEQWHPTKNADLTPKDITQSSTKKVWWVCEKGHEWETTVAHRANGTGCPYCSDKRAYVDNCLQTLNPELAEQWHPTKNGNLTPNDVTLGSNKKVWWVCEKGHEWEALICSRTNKNGCPYCAGQRACADNCLQVLNPELAEQWHPTKNGDLTPNNVMPSSNKKVWWICDKGHEWEAITHSRNKGNGCPYCAGKRVCADNCLQTLNPELARQWHAAKNGNLTPNNVTPGSSKKVWWQCGKGHEWEAVIASRNMGNGCPFCKNTK